MLYVCIAFIDCEYVKTFYIKNIYYIPTRIRSPTIVFFFFVVIFFRIKRSKKNFKKLFDTGRGVPDGYKLDEKERRART